MDRAWDNAKPGANGCWASLLYRDCKRYRLKVGSKKVDQLQVLWWIQYRKDPEGQLSNACGDTMCINPAHYRDQVDREQQKWQVWKIKDIDKQLIDFGIDPDDGYSYQIHMIGAEHKDQSTDAAGMTRMFCCYHCNAVFDPMASRNTVVCDDCWTDEDQAQSEEEE